jgi:hypothetical protein
MRFFGISKKETKDQDINLGLKNSNKKSSKKTPVNIIFDIRSSSVGVAIYALENGEIPNIIYTDRNYTVLNNIKDSKDYKNKLYRLIDQTIDELVEKGIVPNSNLKQKLEIKKVICSFSAPWYDPHIENINIKSEKPRKFTKEDFVAILKKENKIIKDSETLSVIDRKIISARINGYEVVDPFAKKFKKLSLSFYTGVVNSSTKKEISEKIETKLNPKQIDFYTHPLVLLTSFKSLYHSLTDFILFDFNGEITEISLFKNDILVSVSSIPVGINFFISELMNKMEIDKNTAMSLLNLYADSKLNPAENTAATIAINGAISKWSQNVYNILKKDWSKESGPQTIFVTADTSFEKLIRKILSDKQVYEKTLKVNNPPILHVTNSLNTKELNFYKKNIERDPLLSLITYFSTLT